MLQAIWVAGKWAAKRPAHLDQGDGPLKLVRQDQFAPDDLLSSAREIP